jgi:NAD(P)-dependent dehydrogenase (short-subunit alcohol dehydrogenase family)
LLLIILFNITVISWKKFLPVIGLGFETTKHIVQMGGMVIMACREEKKALDAKEQIIKEIKCSKEKIIVLNLDLSSLDSVRKFVKSFQALQIPLHALVNNAGVMMTSRQVTVDNPKLEKVFTVNYLSHFLLTNLLLPELEKTNGRVVNLASTMHKILNAFSFDDLMSEKQFSLFGTYAQSKLAMILMTTAFQKR